MLQKLLGITIIDIFVLSSFLSSSPSVTKTWKTLEGYHRQGILRRLGVSDYSEQQLKATLENPEFAVKPTVNQVNYTFCDIPDSLKTMATQNNVDLLYTLDSKGKAGRWGGQGSVANISFRDTLKEGTDCIESG